MRTRTMRAGGSRRMAAGLLLCLGAAQLVAGAAPKEDAPPGATRPAAAARDFDASAYGAKPDGITPATSSIQKAIDAASAAGGGVVVLPPGVYMTGSLFLKSGAELRLDDGVTLRAIPDDAAFPEIPSRSAGIEMPWPAALINAVGQTNVKLTGAGLLDGNGPFWWRKFWGDDRRGGMRADYTKRGLAWAVGWDCRRPPLVLFKDCRDVQVRGLRLIRSPFWTVQLTYCSGVAVDGLTIRNNLGGRGPSTDGIDVDSSRDVAIRNCDIDCNDDNICLKAGRDADGLRVGRPTENVLVSDCVTRAGDGMLTLGSETSGGIRNVEIRHMRAIGTTNGIRFKSKRVRGGVVEGVRIRDVVMDGVANPFLIRVGDNQEYPVPAGTPPADLPPHWKVLGQKLEPPERGIPEFRDISISDVTATGAAQAFAVSGNPEKPVRGVRWSNVKVQAARAGAVRNAADWAMQDVVVEAADGKPVRLEDCRAVETPAVVKSAAAGAAGAAGEPPEPLRLDVVSEHAGPLIGPDYPGTEGNRSGFETGCVVLHDGTFHLFVNEMFGRPDLELRVAHWTSADGVAWERKGTVVESVPGRSPLNPRAEVWLTGAAFDEVENRWDLFYVTYRGGDGARGEIAGSDYDGKIWRAVSLTPGRGGVGGPYRDVDIVLRPDEHSLPWEGQQGVDSFFPYRVGEQWYGFYGSHNHLPRGPWQVGLARAPCLEGPWQRTPELSPTPLAKNFVENPVVQEVAPRRWLALFDSDAPHAVGYSTSTDGAHWTPEHVLVVQSEGARWSGDSGLRDVRTPLGLLRQKDGTYLLLYTARTKSGPFRAIGECTVRLTLDEPAAGTAGAK